MYVSIGYKTNDAGTLNQILDDEYKRLCTLCGIHWMNADYSTEIFSRTA